jgi:hypothetical protein
MDTFNWRNIELSCYPDMYGVSDLVFMIKADLEISSDNGIVTKEITVGVSFNPNSTYTPISEVTRDKAVEWIEGALTTEELTRIKSIMSLDLNLFKTVHIPNIGETI